MTTPSPTEALTHLRDSLPDNPANDGPVDVALRVLLDAFLTQEDATWYTLPSEEPGGLPARWSDAINAIVSDSGKWDRWPATTAEGAWWNARVAQSAIENLYRCGFAVVRVPTSDAVGAAPDTEGAAQ